MYIDHFTTVTGASIRSYTVTDVSFTNDQNVQ